jgi:hypothetical protein
VLRRDADGARARSRLQRYFFLAGAFSAGVFFEAALFIGVLQAIERFSFRTSYCRVGAKALNPRRFL